MDEATLNKLRQYLQALRALQKAVERSMQQGMVDGTGRMVVKNYRGLQQKIAELLPDDFFITDTLTLELDDNASDEQMLGQVQLASSQMLIYLDGLVKESSRSAGFAFSTGGETTDWKNVARDLQEQIANLTRSTVKRALSNIEVDIDVNKDRPGAVIRDADLAGKDMQGAHLEGASLRDVHGVGTNFRGAHLTGTDMKRGNLDGADFTGAVMEGANLIDANLNGTTLIEVRADGINLKNSNLNSADLSGSSLEGANLANASMVNARCIGTNFSGAQFRGANLNGADFTDARMSGANLRDTDLQGANLTGARLNGAILPDGAIYISGMNLARYGVVQGEKPKNDER